MVSKLVRRGVLCGLIGLGVLSTVSCRDDPPQGDDEAELDVDEPDDEPAETGEIETVTVRGPGSVDPTLPVPSVQTPPGWKDPVRRPELPDSGARPEPPKGPVDPLAAELRMRDLHAIAIRPVPKFDPAGRAVDDPSRLEDLKAWRKASDEAKEALEEMVSLGSRYMDTVGADAAPANVRYQFGYALEVLADRRPGDAARSMRLDAIDQLKRFLAAPADSTEELPDAELHLALALLKVGDEYGPVVDEAVDHLSKSAALSMTARRPDEAGLATMYALNTLISFGRDREAHELAQKLEAGSASFGGRTSAVRRLAHRASLYVGARLPELEGVKDTEGRPISFEQLRGGPVIVHLFQSSLPTGDASTDRSIETVLVPLAREFGPKGLHLVGGSLDLALAPERVEQIRSNWEEWGKKGKVQDGGLETVTDWCASIGMDWPLSYDGKWFEGTLAMHLGEQEPCAVLLDADGVIRWRGKPPFDGLREALLTVLQR